MKRLMKLNVILAFILCLVAGQAASAEDLVISGFFDVISSYDNNADDKTDFAMNQAELDLNRRLGERAAAEVSVAYNSEDAVFELGRAFLDIYLYGGEEGYNYGFINTAILEVGQFDVPFGVDHHVYRSINRKLITPPLAVGYTHEGWNDFGVNVRLNAQYWNLVAFWVNGFESSYEIIDAAQALTLGLSVGDEINTTPANAFGGRLGFTPIENVELGGSFSMGINESNEDEMMLFGGDIQLAYQDFKLKGEYIGHSLNRSLAQEDNKGYYVQGLYNFKEQNFFLVSRYGSFQPEGADWVWRYTGGIGYIVTDGVEIRFETTLHENSDNNTNLLQFVAGF